MKTFVRIINDILAFMIEMASVLLYGVLAYQQGESQPVKLLFAIFAAAIFAFIWGRFFAPKATHPLKGWLRWILEYVILMAPVILYFREKPQIFRIIGSMIFLNLLVQATLGRGDFKDF